MVNDVDLVLDRTATELRDAQDLERVQEVVRIAARRLTMAQGATVVLLENGQCFYADEDAISPLWKGQRFPVEQCISGWAMLNKRAAVVPDISVDERIPQAAYAPTFVRSLVMVPVGVADPIGAIGAYWSRTRTATSADLDGLTRLS